MSKLSIRNFRKLSKVDLPFQPGLNVMVGANNVGKTAVIDALRALLAGYDEPYPWLDATDIHRPKNGSASGEIEFKYIFSGLTPAEEADLMPALVSVKNGFEAWFTIRYVRADNSDRLRPMRTCGEFGDASLNSDVLEHLRGVYLPPLRDASQGLRPGRTSKISRLFQLLTEEGDDGRRAIDKALAQLDEKLRDEAPVKKTFEAISSRHRDMLGGQMAQALELGLTGTDFLRLASRLSLSVDAYEIEQNGLGFNNLLFMAVVLSELAKSPEASYRGLIVEEPEAHLHPQLQAVLLRYLQSIETKSEDKRIQLFVTSHSPNFASIADLESLLCLIERGDAVDAFAPRNVTFEKGKRAKLARYLDVTRAEIFFARRIIFVEGAAELMIINELAVRCGFDLREHGVSLISVEGLNFDSFMPLFGEGALRIPVAILTDADPQETVDGNQTPQPLYPGFGEQVKVSDNTSKMQKLQDSFVRVFCGVKTFEYDLALHIENHSATFLALEDLHPVIAKELQKVVDSEKTAAGKAGELFRGMFERGKSTNVQKGSFGQALANVLANKNVKFEVPPYIRDAISHACRKDLANGNI